MTEYIIQALKTMWEWLLATVKAMLEAIFEPIADMVPDVSNGWDLGPVVQFMGFLNTWIALDWGVGLLVCYFVFISCMLAIKFLIKFIPGMPG